MAVGILNLRGGSSLPGLLEERELFILYENGEYKKTYVGPEGGGTPVPATVEPEWNEFLKLLNNEYNEEESEYELEEANMSVFIYEDGYDPTRDFAIQHADDLAIHRKIDDNSTGSTILWSGEKINTELQEKASKQVSVSVVSAASYFISLSDEDVLLVADDTDTQSFIIPTNSSVAFPIGTSISFSQNGGGAISVEPVNGTVSINSFDGNNTLAGDYATASIVKVGTDEWLLTGNLV